MKLSLLNTNIIANLLGTSWSIFSIYFFLPFYLRLLGEENYGLVMFSVSIQAIIFLFDAGFSSSLRRELAWGDKNDQYQKRNLGLIYNIEFFYGFIFLVIGIFSIIFSPWLAENWFVIKTININIVRWSIVLMVFNAILQMQSSLYNGSLFALNRQVLGNFLQFLFTFFRNGVVIFVLIKYPSPIAFLVWQLAVVFIYVIAQRAILLSKFENKFQLKKFNFDSFKNIWKISSLFLIISILSTVNLQIDKLIISKIMPLSSIGFYNTSFTLGQIMVSICGPISAAISPILINNFSLKKNEHTANIFHKYAKFCAIISCSLGFTILLNNYNIVYLWTNNSHFAKETASINPYMIFASMLLSWQVIPYTLAVASANLKPIIYTCLINILLTIPAYIYFGKELGLNGIAYIWFISNIFMLFINVYFYLKKSIPKEFKRWMIYDFLLPLIICGSITYFIEFLRPHSKINLMEAIYIGLVFLISITISFIIFYYKIIKNSIFLNINKING